MEEGEVMWEERNRRKAQEKNGRVGGAMLRGRFILTTPLNFGAPLVNYELYFLPAK
jgi:hypothetical protein